MVRLSFRLAKAANWHPLIHVCGPPHAGRAADGARGCAAAAVPAATCQPLLPPAAAKGQGSVPACTPGGLVVHSYAGGRGHDSCSACARASQRNQTATTATYLVAVQLMRNQALDAVQYGSWAGDGMLASRSVLRVAAGNRTPARWSAVGLRLLQVLFGLQQGAQLRTTVYIPPLTYLTIALLTGCRPGRQP